MEKIIGIDLGTSNSAAAVVISGKPVVIPSAEGTTLGGKAFPSYVAFTKDQETGTTESRGNGLRSKEEDGYRL